MKIKTKSKKTLNECLGVSDEEYTKRSMELFDTCVEKLSQEGTLSFAKVADEVMKEVRHKHLGKINSKFSAYELELFVAGLQVRWLLTNEVEQSIHLKAYAKQLNDGLNEF